jgi:hypothetical protein
MSIGGMMMKYGVSRNYLFVTLRKIKLEALQTC